MERMPRWADVILTPLISLFLAFAISALVILAIGESPVEALTVERTILDETGIQILVRAGGVQAVLIGGGD